MKTNFVLAIFVIFASFNSYAKSSKATRKPAGLPFASMSDQQWKSTAEKMLQAAFKYSDEASEKEYGPGIAYNASAVTKIDGSTKTKPRSVVLVMRTGPDNVNCSYEVTFHPFNNPTQIKLKDCAE